MIEIDGSFGEGGGQMLRSALALSMCTGQAFRMVNVRAKRQKPGLLRQHLTAVQAATEVSCATVSHAEIGSLELSFSPGKVSAGKYGFSIGTAGSCTLVLQTILPALMTASGESVLRISGGTHNKASPPVDFLQRAYLPLIERMGPSIQLNLLRHGFYPRGGGEIEVKIRPSSALSRLSLLKRGERRASYAEAYLAGIPLHVASRELKMVGEALGWPAEQLHVRGLSSDLGPGNALTITLEHASITEVFTGFGEKGVSAENVAHNAIAEARVYLATDAPVGPHLADQLLLPMALQGGGEFVTSPITPHFVSHSEVISKFLDVRVVTTARDRLVQVRLV